MAAILPFLSHSSENHRAQAAQALGKIADPGAVGALLEMFADRSFYVKGHVFEALAAIGDPRAVEPLIEVLLTEVRHTLRLRAAEALQKFTDPRVVTAFTLVVDDPNPHVRYVVASLLAQHDDPGILPYLKMLALDEHDGVREIAQEGVERILSGDHSIAVKAI
ncbi:hypothetical protein CCAX7_60250 [Capsulimonas corticalis]|uniref:Uncharacterized protein n=2 Tax=Capsulimonas corticalis TaxID=2219043 RepID=A0A402CVV7_9BACT|nr:hypothetical protein CCAX7_60250 [Capsulimonas corticalis]